MAFTLTVLVFRAICLAGGAVGVEVDAMAGAFVVPFPAGVPARLGSPLTVRSLPWVSMRATGNSANFASSATGRRDFARLNTASTSEDLFVESLHSYYTLHSKRVNGGNERGYSQHSQTGRPK